MAETATPNPARSLELVEQALAYEGSLRGRTEGLTWMAWGFVLAGIFFTYGSLGGLSESGGLPWWTFVLWVPWVLAGSAFTWTLWRTAGLAMPLPARRPAGLLVTLAWIAAIVAGLALASLVPGGNAESAPLLAVGVAWLAMGALDLFRATPAGRRATLLIGALTAGAALLMIAALPPPDWSSPGAGAARFAQDLLRGGVAGGVPLAVGMWQSLRG